MILTPLQKLPKNVRDLGKLIVANGLKKLPKVQKIAQSGHTGRKQHFKLMNNALRPGHIAPFSVYVCGRWLHFRRKIEKFLSLH